MGHFFAKLDRVRCINILGMSRETERDTGKQAGKKGHRCRRMGKMGVKMGDVAAGQKFVDQKACLKQVLEGCGFSGAQKTPDSHIECRSIAPGLPCRQDQVLRQQDMKRCQKSFRKIVHGRLDPADAGVEKCLPGPAHGQNMQLQALFFQQKDFIGYKGFGNPGIAFQDHPQHGRWRAQSSEVLNMSSRSLMAFRPVN